jgi:UDP-GlcNAc:undecaprenyl-phosphate/decaprenyl-phosphate GlcNAc-1-phosphate transferase
MSPVIAVLSLLVPMLAVYAGVAAMLRWGRPMLVEDLPNARSAHGAPVPRGGGLVIVTVFLGCFGLYQMSVGKLMDWRTFVIFTSGAGFVALVSWLDDVHLLSNRVRLVAQVLAAMNAIAVFGYWHDVTFPFLGEVHLGLAGLPFTLLWVIGLANAFNFIDGTDGMVAAQAVTGGLWAAVVGFLLGAPVLSVLGLIIAGACIGFLLHNWWPARIFMGDVGSVFIGYVFAILMVNAGRHDPVVVLAAGLLFGPVVLDTGFTFVRRAVRGERVFESHRTHLYQRLVTAGESHRSVALLYVGLSVGFGLLAVLWLVGEEPSRPVVSLMVAAMVMLLWLLVKLAEHRGRSGGSGATAAQGVPFTIARSRRMRSGSVPRE